MIAPRPSKERVELRFRVNGLEHHVIVVDERSAGYSLDPTLTVFRGDEEEPVATVHLSHRAPCFDATHVVVRPAP